MLGFFAFFTVLVVGFIAWSLTIRNRIRGKGASALDSFIALPIDQAQTVALQRGFTEELERHFVVWRTIGGLKGMRTLHHDAACLIEAWNGTSANLNPQEASELDQLFTRLGACVLWAAIEAVTLNAMRRFGVRRENLVPPLHATYAVSCYAEIQARIRTLCEAYSEEMLTLYGSKI